MVNLFYFELGFVLIWLYY